MKITVLDKNSFSNNDIDLSSLDKLGKVEYYDVLPREEVFKILTDTEVVICNKTVFDKELIENCNNLKYIGLTATGFNNVDLIEATKRGIVVTNVPNYSTVDVAQHVFAMLFHYANNVYKYDNSVKNGKWLTSKTFCFFEEPVIELDGKTFGVIGYGNIGKRVAKIADALGMRVLIYSRSKKDCEYTQTDLETLLKESDFVSLHCPLNDQTSRLINEKTLKLMKNTSVLINTSRGGVIDELALKTALENGEIAHALLDVLSVEPMEEACPLRKVKNVTFTPHIAWAPVECRQRLIEIVAKNVIAFKNGAPQNKVN